ncbi:MAG: hypothetical protein WCI27_10340 [Candidatus Omnitrophota bacterium]
MMPKIIFFVLAVLFCFTGIASAQFFIEGGKESLAVAGGDRISKSIIIHNTSSEGHTIRAYWEDFKYDPPFDGTKSFSPSGTGERSLGKWISFSPTEFTVPPFSQQKVNYTLVVPDDIDSGHYGVLFFEKVGDPVRVETGMQIITRVGSLFFVEPKDAVKKAEFQNIVLSEGKLKFSFYNHSAVVLIPDITYYFMDDQGVVADRGDIKKLYLPPDTAGAFDIDLPETLTAHVYTLVVNADLGDNNTVVKEIEISKDLSDKFTISTMRD